MTDQEIADYFNTFQTGEKRLVPFVAEGSLGPDTQGIRNELEKKDEQNFTLTTFFREYWAGHGWSNEQAHAEELSLEKLKAKLSRRISEKQ